MVQRNMKVTDKHRYEWYVHVLTVVLELNRDWGHAGGFDAAVMRNDTLRC